MGNKLIATAIVLSLFLATYALVNNVGSQKAYVQGGRGALIKFDLKQLQQEKGVCASVSDPPADTLLRFGPLPNKKNPCEVEVNPIRPVSPSYAISRLGIAEAIDYLSNTDFLV